MAFDWLKQIPPCKVCGDTTVKDLKSGWLAEAEWTCANGHRNNTRLSRGADRNEHVSEENT